LKRLFVAVLLFAALRMVLARVRRFADPDPGIYGHPRRRDTWTR